MRCSRCFRADHERRDAWKCASCHRVFDCPTLFVRAATGRGEIVAHLVLRGKDPGEPRDACGPVIAYIPAVAPASPLARALAHANGAS